MHLTVRLLYKVKFILENKFAEDGKNQAAMARVKGSWRDHYKSENRL